MKRNNRKSLALLAAVLLLVSLLSGCGGSSSSSSSASYGGGSYAATPSASAPAAAMDSGWAEAPMEEADYGYDYKEDSGESVNVAAGRKLIRTATLELETTDFAGSNAAIGELVESMGGFFEYSEVANSNGRYRWASYRARVPAEKLDLFLDQAGSICHELRRFTNVDDITESYYDTSGRLDTAKIKLQRLQTLLEQATEMEDIIALESAISETEWTIDNLSGTVRHYDDQVAYSTVSITLNEVYKLSNAEPEPPKSFGERIAKSFGEGLEDFVDSFEDFLVDLAYSWLHILVFVAVIVVIVLVIRRLIGRSRRRRLEKKAAEAAALSEKSETDVK